MPPGKTITREMIKTNTGGLDLVRLRASLEVFVEKLPIHDIDKKDYMSKAFGEPWELIVDKIFADMWNSIVSKNAWLELADYLEFAAQLIRYSQHETDVPPEMEPDELNAFRNRMAILQIEYDRQMELERRELERESRARKAT